MRYGDADLRVDDVGEDSLLEDAQPSCTSRFTVLLF